MGIVLGKLLANAAAETSCVKRFRAEGLRGNLLSIEQISEWIDSKAKEEGTAAHMVLSGISMPQDQFWNAMKAQSGTPAETALADVALNSSQRWKQSVIISYQQLKWRESGGRQKVLSVAFGRTLDRLRSISALLAKDLHWSAADATSFVLTGAVPELGKGTVKINLNLRWSALDRIAIEVPPAATPDDVSSMYGDARRRYRQWQSVAPERF